MKSIIRYVIIVMTTVLALASCNKNKKGDQNVSVVGEWKLETFSGMDATEQNTDVYLVFTEAKTFTIYQKLGKGHFSEFNGTYSVTGNVLNGTYSNGSAWGSSYEVSVEKGVLTMTAKDVSSNEVSIYISSTVPESVKQDASVYSTTKAAVIITPWL